LTSTNRSSSVAAGSNTIGGHQVYFSLGSDANNPRFDGGTTSSFSVFVALPSCSWSRKLRGICKYTFSYPEIQSIRSCQTITARRGILPQNLGNPTWAVFEIQSLLPDDCPFPKTTWAALWEKKKIIILTATAGSVSFDVFYAEYSLAKRVKSSLKRAFRMGGSQNRSTSRLAIANFFVKKLVPQRILFFQVRKKPF
jgi:hypothetical protein